MAILPDLGTAGLYALAAFLLVLGVLVVFVESVRPSRFLLVLIVCIVAAGGFVALGETGVALVPLGVGGAFVANQVFEWLTMR